jgi:predicted membrane protein
MVRPVGAFLLVFALLSLIVHQIGMFEILGAVGTALLAWDIALARFSKTPHPGSLRDPLI